MVGYAPKAAYLSAPVNGLIEGLYVERTTVAELLARGDFGLGTFNRLDGEMVVLDGRVYQVKSDGVIREVDGSEMTPFACVTTFRADTVDEFPEPPGVELFELVQSILPSRNMLYAIRIEGTYRTVRTRSVPAQENYRPLVEVAREQPEFECRESGGTMVGFHTPDFLGTVSVPGLHLHYLSEDRTCGGHLLSCDPGPVKIYIQHIPELVMALPMTVDFLTMDATRDVDCDLNEAER